MGILPLLSFSQSINTSQNFILLRSDKIIYPSKIVLNRSIFKGYVLGDGIEYLNKNIKFFREHGQVFVNASWAEKPGSKHDYFPQIESGRLNIFQETVITKTKYNMHSRHQTETVSKNINYYYNSGFGKIKKLKYKNLKIDLQGYEESMKYFNSVKRSRITSRTFDYVGYALCLFGIYKGVDRVRKSENDEIKGLGDFSEALTYLGSGFGSLIVANFLLKKEEEKMLKSIRVFNLKNKQ